MARWDVSQQSRVGAPGGGLPVSQLRSEADLVRKLESLRRGRQGLEREWKLNLAFYKGNQYVNYNKRSGQLDYLPVEDGEKPRYRVRIVSNQIQSGSHSLLAQLTKTKPQIYATPSSGAPHDIRAAQMAEMLYEHWWHDLDLTTKLQEALLWGIIAGNGYWKITWDQLAGKPLRFMLDPNGQPILDDDLKEAFRTQLEQMGMEPVEQTVMLGDVRVEVMSPFDVYLDPAPGVYEESRYMFCGHGMDPDEVYERWGKRVQPDSIATDPDTALPWKNSEDRVEPQVKKIWIGYFRPQPGMQKGRRVVFAENPNMILDDGPWPYPISELPIVKFPGVRVPGQVYDDAPVTSARPLQKELNRTISQIVEYKNLTIRPRIVSPVGALRQKITNEPGAVVEYQPIGGLKPEIDRLPSMPPYVFEHLRDINLRLRDVFGLQEITEGKPPPNVEAGVAIDLLQEMATDRWAPTIQQVEAGLARSGRLMVALAQKYYIEPRLIKIHGEGGRIHVKRFLQSDIPSGVDFFAEAGSGLPRTRAARMARVEKLMEMGLVSAHNAWKHVDMADMRGVRTILQADEEHAERENEKLLQGQPLNPEEFQHAYMAVMQGINPDTGEPIESPEEAEHIMKLAALKPGPADNHQVHYDTHRLPYLQAAFENWPSDARERMILHLELTQQAMSKLPQPEPEAARVSLGLRATVDPDTAAKVLQSAGIEATPDELRQEPMTTATYDSLDKPDADQAGNDPLLASEMEQHQADEAANTSLISQAKAVEATARAQRALREADPNDPLKEPVQQQSGGGGQRG
jgi:hypothetical protein